MEFQDPATPANPCWTFPNAPGEPL